MYAYFKYERNNMIYIEAFQLPSSEKINDYISNTNLTTYPWSIFLENGFEWINCKEITIFYGNNGSGKSTLINVLAEKISAQRNNELFKDIVYGDYGAEIHPFDNFVQYVSVKMGYDDLGYPIIMPKVRKLITSDDIFKRIDERSRHNRRTLMEIEQARNKHDEIIGKGYTYRNSDDYDNLVKLLEARRLSKRKYAEVHAKSKESMKSNGETAIEFYSRSFETGGIYFLDEPENCLSPLFQIELIKLIQDATRYFDCQFFICTHSPLLLSLFNAIIYNLDMRPVIRQKWEELENVRIYYDFFKQNKDKFE